MTDDGYVLGLRLKMMIWEHCCMHMQLISLNMKWETFSGEHGEGDAVFSNDSRTVYIADHFTYLPSYVQ